MEKTDIMYKLRKNWLFLLIAAQPVLDALAYWTNNSGSSWAGYIRLAIMIILPVSIFFKLPKKKHFALCMLIIGIPFALHIINCFRVGYIDPVRDIRYAASVAQMPVLAVCFVYAISSESMRNSALKALKVCAALAFLLLVAAIVTGTDNCTYGVGMGVSGWVIDNNRCANSIILVTLSCFAMLYSAESDKKIAKVLVPLAIAWTLIANGTKACYYGLFAILFGYALFEVLSKKLKAQRIDKLFVAALLLLAVISAAIYPITPRHKVELLEARAVALKDEDELVRQLKEKGYDPNAMTTEEKISNPEIKQMFEDYYRKLMWHVVPEMFDRFSIERILLKYDMTTSAAKLIDVRLMKRTYASLIWDDCDALTKIVGYEVSQIHDKGLDPENDYPALFWYYGYVGCGMYMLFLAFFIYCIFKKVLRGFRTVFTQVNFALLISFALQLGLAQFSGALVRRPNVSVYLSVILALIYYQTVRTGDNGRELENEA